MIDNCIINRYKYQMPDSADGVWKTGGIPEVKNKLRTRVRSGDLSIDRFGKMYCPCGLDVMVSLLTRERKGNCLSSLRILLGIKYKRTRTICMFDEDGEEEDGQVSVLL